MLFEGCRFWEDVSSCSEAWKKR